MRKLFVIPIYFVLIALSSFSCQEYENFYSSEKTVKIQEQILSLNLPAEFKQDKDVANSSTGWSSLNHSKYKGEVNVFTDENGHISAIKLRGEIVNFVSKDILYNYYSLKPNKNGDLNLIVLGNERNRLEEYGKCMGGCLPWGGWSPMSWAVCSTYCAIQQI